MPNYSGIWTLSQQFQGRGQGLWPTPPGVPTIGTATAGGNNCASVTFTAPACAGVPAPITGYTATSTPGCVTASGAASPLTVTGLTTGTSYTFKVKAQNATGFGACSAASNSITAAVVTCATYTTPGTYSWVAPTGVTSVAAVVVGGGAGGSTCRGGGGAGLSWKNSISVTPGSSYTVVVGAGGAGTTSTGFASNGGQSSFSGATANGGSGSGPGGTFSGGGGGGTGGSGGGTWKAGGGAGGYCGNGGAGGDSENLYGLPGQPGATNSGAAGGGFGTARSVFCCFSGLYYYTPAGGGGGVGLFGKGSTGIGGNSTSRQGGAGSGGGGLNFTPCGGLRGGGGGAGGRVCGTCGVCYRTGGNGGNGAVRIVWAGGARGTPSFPSTNVGP